MSKHSQRRAGPGPLQRAAPLLLGALVTTVIWLYLVGAAIDFGGVAIHGEIRAWVFMLAPMLGAVASLVVMMSLLTRALTELGVIGDGRPRQAGGRRRAR